MTMKTSTPFIGLRELCPLATALVIAVCAPAATPDNLPPRSVKTETFNHIGGNRTVVSPKYSGDIALGMRRQPPTEAHLRTAPTELVEFFAPPEQYQSDFGKFRSPLEFADGTRVQSPADWQRRRGEILFTWHKIMGPWPPLIESPRVQVVNTTRRENISQQQLRIEIALGGEMVDALLLVPA